MPAAAGTAGHRPALVAEEEGALRIAWELLPDLRRRMTYTEATAWPPLRTAMRHVADAYRRRQQEEDPWTKAP